MLQYNSKSTHSWTDIYLLMSSKLVLDFQTYCNIIHGCVQIDSQNTLIVIISGLVIGLKRRILQYKGCQ